ncbi:hypothetical protein TCAP_06375, partial [Tolypocladium capitatum]
MQEMPSIPLPAGCLPAGMSVRTKRNSASSAMWPKRHNGVSTTITTVLSYKSVRTHWPMSRDSSRRNHTSKPSLPMVWSQGARIGRTWRIRDRCRCRTSRRL